VGDNKPISVDVRILSATNRNLKKLVYQGRYREDLFYRINVIPITIPPLRERIWDIPLLAEAFFRKIQLRNNYKKIQSISNDAMRFLMEYSWPGNVRELKSAFEYAFVTCQETTILPTHLPPEILKEKRVLKTVKKPSLNREDIKKKRLIETLKQTNGNQSEAAVILGVSRVTIWNQMKRFGINLKRGIDAQSSYLS